MQKILFWLIAIIALPKVNFGQANSQYIDSINEQVKYIDSLIAEYNTNPVSEIAIEKNMTHFSSLQKQLCSYATLYKDANNGNIFLLFYKNGCDSILIQQDYYFKYGKIIFIRTVKSSNYKEQLKEYYTNDLIINSSANKKYIDEGYILLNRISN